MPCLFVKDKKKRKSNKSEKQGRSFQQQGNASVCAIVVTRAN